MDETLLHMAASKVVLNATLSTSGLPVPVQNKLKNQFKDQLLDEPLLAAAIRAEKHMLDELTGSGNVVGMGGTRVIIEPTEKLQAACDKMFGLPVKDEAKQVASFRSLRAAYTEITGDTDVRGYLDDQNHLRQLRAAGFDSSTFAYVLGNTLYRRMISDYQEIGDFGISLVVGQNIRNARDFRTIESVRIAYYGDLPDVNPEVNTPGYSDLGTLSDEKVDYVLGQKGGIITISRKMIINDDIRAIDTIRKRLPRAARRTLAKTVWAPIISNAVYKGDNKAMFHADHANLDSTVFGMAAVLAMKTRMYNQTEPSSGAVLGLRLKNLVIPEALWGAAITLNQTPNFLISGVTSGNPFFHFFGANNENIFVNPLMTDASDFLGLADMSDCECVELAFMNGQQEPEMFIADNPNFGQFFINDQIQYKIMHEYSAVATDFRGVQKNIVVG